MKEIKSIQGDNGLLESFIKVIKALKMNEALFVIDAGKIIKTLTYFHIWNIPKSHPIS